MSLKLFFALKGCCRLCPETVHYVKVNTTAPWGYYEMRRLADPAANHLAAAIIPPPSPPLNECVMPLEQMLWQGVTAEDMQNLS